MAARWPHARVGLSAAILLVMWGLKRHYAAADVGDLSWVLAPVAELAALVSRARFEWEPGSGYLSRERLFVIAKPCAGVNFMLAALAMVGYELSKRADSWRSSARSFASTAMLAYCATVVANTTRITFALWLAAHPFASVFWTPARVHRAEGIVVYFGMLALLHVVVQHLSARPRANGDAPSASVAGSTLSAEAPVADTPMTATSLGARMAASLAPTTLRWARLPLVSYYLVTVVIPLANGSGALSRAFLEHMAFVVLAPPTLVGLFALIRIAWQRATASGGAVQLSTQRSP